MDFTAIAWTCLFQPSSGSLSKKDPGAGSLDCQGHQGHVKIGPSLHPKDQRVFITQQLFLSLCSAAGVRSAEVCGLLGSKLRQGGGLVGSSFAERSGSKYLVRLSQIHLIFSREINEPP